MGSLPTLDFCFYCRGYIPDWTFPHLCKSCLELIKNGDQPVTKMIQGSLSEKDEEAS